MFQRVLLYCLLLALLLSLAIAEEKCGLEPPKEGEDCGGAPASKPDDSDVIEGADGDKSIPDDSAAKDADDAPAESLGCISWRQTGNCNPYGSREPNFDVGCQVIISKGASGYCECEGGVQVAHVGCDHEPFFCEAKCADPKSQNPQDEDHEETKRKTIEFLNSEDPYLVLGLERSASPKDVRRAYRELSLKYHPDKNAGDEEAADKFSKVVAAYEVLGDPDKRASYDNLGDGAKQGFDTFWEYQQSGATSDKDFFEGNPLITQITESVWNDRIAKGNHVWFVEFYAPWCSHCIQGAPHWRELAINLEDDEEFGFDVEIGAVNGVKERNLMEKFGVKAYPTLILFSLRHNMEMKYPSNKARTPHEMQEWLKKQLTEWEFLHVQAHLVTLVPGVTPEAEEKEPELDADGEPIMRKEIEVIGFDDMLETDDFWIVLFMKGVDCRTCVQAKVNAHRLSADVRGLAKVGLFECDADRASWVLCHETYEVTPGEFLGFPHGGKGAGGTLLFNPKEHASHLALELISKLVKLTLRSFKIEEGAVEPLKGEAGEYLEDEPEEEEEEKPEPPPPFEHYGYAGEDINQRRIGGRSGKPAQARIGA